MTNPTRPVKYIFVTGGVVSSLGKGLAAASIGALLEGHGYRVARPGELAMLSAPRKAIVTEAAV